MRDSTDDEAKDEEAATVGAGESQGDSETEDDESDPRTQVWNGVAVPTVAPEEGRDYVPEMEAATSAALRRRVRRGDDVVVVGGGRGITTVWRHG